MENDSQHPPWATTCILTPTHAKITYIHIHMYITPSPNVDRKMRKQDKSKYISEWACGMSEGVNERTASAYVNKQVWE